MSASHRRHPWHVLAAGVPLLEAEALLDGLKQYRVAKSDPAPCSVCILPAPHVMRVQRLLCSCKSCSDVALTTKCPWRGRVMRCEQQGLVTVEEAYAHLTPARGPRSPGFTPAMKEVVKDWAAQGLKPKRIWIALVDRFNLREATAPSLATVQRFTHHHVTRRLGGSDVLDVVRKKVRDSAFTGGEEETAAFTFSSLRDSEGRPTVGNGSDANPFVVGVSSKKLLRRADRDPTSFVFHLDATYKLTQAGYPVIVVGISDRARRFHLMAIFIVSQQQQQQHTEVLALLCEMYTAVTSKPFRVRYVMGDADAAQWNAVHEVFGQGNQIVFLMCYFHVAKKVYEKTRSLLPATRASVMADVHKLHFTSGEAEFHAVLAEVQGKWSKQPELAVFSRYFSNVWLNQRVWRWQCFHTPAGYATTNNPCETYNAVIKRDVTMRRKLKVGALLPQLLLLCESEGMIARPFSVTAEPDARLVRRVRSMSRAGLLSLHSISRNSVAFLLTDPADEIGPDVVRVTSRAAPLVFDETKRRTVEDLPVSSQLGKLTAAMETLGMPVAGWGVNVHDKSCPCKYWSKYGSCVHTLYAMESRGSTDLRGRETLVNRSSNARRGNARAGRPCNNGPALAKD